MKNEPDLLEIKMLQIMHLLLNIDITSLAFICNLALIFCFKWPKLNIII